LRAGRLRAKLADPVQTPHVGRERIDDADLGQGPAEPLQRFLHLDLLAGVEHVIPGGLQQPAHPHPPEGVLVREEHGAGAQGRRADGPRRARRSPAPRTTPGRAPRRARRARALRSPERFLWTPPPVRIADGPPRPPAGPSTLPGSRRARNLGPRATSTPLLSG